MFENLSYEAFKEPRGFLKILQWLFAICAFATTCNFTTEVSVTLECPTTGNGTVAPQRITHVIEYPFHLDHESVSLTVNSCLPPGGPQLQCQLVGDAKSDSQFFVTTGVLTFLYSTALVAVYLLSDKSYTENPSAAKIDFVVTLVFAVFWLSGSAAWANGLSAVKSGSNPQNWITVLSDKAVGICNEKGTTGTGFICTNPIEGAFGGIVISILFGFINFILWAANLWFLYKETPWFDGIGKSSGITSPGTSGA